MTRIASSVTPEQRADVIALCEKRLNTKLDVDGIEVVVHMVSAIEPAFIAQIVFHNEPVEASTVELLVELPSQSAQIIGVDIDATDAENYDGAAPKHDDSREWEEFHDMDTFLHEHGFRGTP